MLNNSLCIHKISFSVGSRAAVFKEASPTPDIIFGDEFESKQR